MNGWSLSSVSDPLHLRFCISYKFPGDVDAGGPGLHTLEASDYVVKSGKWIEERNFIFPMLFLAGRKDIYPCGHPCVKERYLPANGFL